jgi:predicted transcriptional regulator of viral defense system
MNANKDTTGFEKIYKILKDQSGIIRTADLANFDIPRTYLSIMEKRGELERASWGVYQSPSFIEDELFIFQSRHKASIYSHETALYLHDLTDRTPLSYSVSVPADYHAASFKESMHKVFYVKRTLLNLGVVTLQSPHGNTLRVTGIERTIVDILRSRSRIEDQLIFDTLKRYVRMKNRNIDLLYRYAQRFRVQSVLRPYMEVLL